VAYRGDILGGGGGGEQRLTIAKVSGGGGEAPSRPFRKLAF